MQAIEPGRAVPGYALANWAVLKELTEILKVNLGKDSNMVASSCLMLPFIRTGMTEEYAGNDKVYGRWQAKVLEPYEAAQSITNLLGRKRDDLDLGNFRLEVDGSADDLNLSWSKIDLVVSETKI